MTGGVKNANGKRDRELDQEDDTEFMPLSKRINSIHISPERNLGHSAFNNQSAIHVNAGANLGPVNHANGYVEQPVHSSYQQESQQFRQHQHHANTGGPSQYMGFNGTVPNSAVNQLPSSSSHNVPPDMPNLNPVSIQYRPALNQSANPHYYESNRALFELYIERQLRNNHVPHPNVFNRTSDDHIRDDTL